AWAMSATVSAGIRRGRRVGYRGPNPDSPWARQRSRHVRTVLRSRPKRWAAGATPWTFTYASTARRSRTFPRYGDFLDRMAIVDPLSRQRPSCLLGGPILE